MLFPIHPLLPFLVVALMMIHLEVPLLWQWKRGMQSKSQQQHYLLQLQLRPQSLQLLMSKK